MIFVAQQTLDQYWSNTEPLHRLASPHGQVAMCRSAPDRVAPNGQGGHGQVGHGHGVAPDGQAGHGQVVPGHAGCRTPRAG